MRKEEPRAASIIQAAENLEGASRQLEHMQQCLSRACTFMADVDMYAKLGEAGVRKQLRNEMPHLSGEIEGWVSWACRMGGRDSVHVKWMFAVSRFVPHGRNLKGALMSAIGDLPTNLGRVKRSLTYAAWQCPQQKVENGFCTWFTANEIKTNRSKEAVRKSAAAAEAAMELLGREITAESPLDQKRVFGSHGSPRRQVLTGEATRYPAIV